MPFRRAAHPKLIGLEPFSPAHLQGHPSIWSKVIIRSIFLLNFFFHQLTHKTTTSHDLYLSSTTLLLLTLPSTQYTYLSTDTETAANPPFARGRPSLILSPLLSLSASHSPRTVVSFFPAFAQASRKLHAVPHRTPHAQRKTRQEDRQTLDVQTRRDKTGQKLGRSGQDRQPIPTVFEQTSDTE